MKLTPTKVGRRERGWSKGLSMAKDDWIITAEAAEISGYHSEYIRELIRAGRIKAQKHHTA